MKESTIDDNVLRLFRTELRYGFTDRPQFDPADSTYSVADRAVALQGALESITLLKNEGHLLPLDAAKIKTIAIIGPNAWPAVPGGGGSSEARLRAGQHLTGIANLLGPDVHVLYSARPAGDDRQSSETRTGRTAVKVETYPSNDFTGTPETGTRHNVDRLSEMRSGGGRPMQNPAQHSLHSDLQSRQSRQVSVLVGAASGEDTFKDRRRWQDCCWPAPRRRPASEVSNTRSRRRPDDQRRSRLHAAFAGSRFGLGIVAAA